MLWGRSDSGTVVTRLLTVRMRAECVQISGIRSAARDQECMVDRELFHTRYECRYFKC